MVVNCILSLFSARYLIPFVGLLVSARRARASLQPTSPPVPRRCRPSPPQRAASPAIPPQLSDIVQRNWAFEPGPMILRRHYGLCQRAGLTITREPYFSTIVAARWSRGSQWCCREISAPEREIKAVIDKCSPHRICGALFFNAGSGEKFRTVSDFSPRPAVRGPETISSRRR